jgi:hypothetical protein
MPNASPTCGSTQPYTAGERAGAGMGGEVTPEAGNGAPRPAHTLPPAAALSYVPRRSPFCILKKASGEAGHGGESPSGRTDAQPPPCLPACLPGPCLPGPRVAVSMVALMLLPQAGKRKKPMMPTAAASKTAPAVGAGAWADHLLADKPRCCRCHVGGRCCSGRRLQLRCDSCRCRCMLPLLPRCH